MGRLTRIINIRGKPARRIEVTGKPQRKIAAEQFAEALGAEPCDAPTFLRREPAPPDGLLRGEVVVYKLAGREWRCSERTWHEIQNPTKPIVVQEKRA